MQTAVGREDPPGGHLCGHQKGCGEPVEGVLFNIRGLDRESMIL
jgi:hypothetical protein